MADLDGYLMVPGVQQVLRPECERIILKTGEVTRTVTYGLTSLRPAEATPAQIAQLWQGHWTIENGVQYVRDVTLGEDAGQVHTGDGPQVLAALRMPCWRCCAGADGRTWQMRCGTTMTMSLRHST